MTKKNIIDGWYTKVAGVRRLYGPNGWLRTAVQAWPHAVHQRFEEGKPVVTVDLRPGQMEKARKAVARG